MPQPLIELGGDPSAPIMNIAPANGFVPETYLPLLKSFTDDYRLVSTPPRALWGDGEPPQLTPEHSWASLAEDMVTAYETFELQNVIVIGHSIGAVTTILSAIQAPERFKAIILLDPVVMPQSVCDYMREQRLQGKASHSPMAEGAMRRRRQFRDVEDAFQNFHGKSVFANWSDEVLRLYVEHGTVLVDDGLRYLTWSPYWEAFYFSTYYTEIWDALPKLDDLNLPILFVAGGNSDVFASDTVQQVAELVPKPTYKTIAGHGHLFPQSAPQQTRDIIAEWLANLS